VAKKTPCNRSKRETSLGGRLLGLVARPPLPVLRLVGSLRLTGFNKALFFVPTEEFRVALTLDDGPHRDTTRRVLDILKDHNARATFFLHGCWAERREDLVAAISDAGHELGNHTWKDTSSRKLSAHDFQRSLSDTHRVLARSESDQPREVKLFRPAGGWPSRSTVSYACTEFDYRTVLASIYPLDAHLRSERSQRWIVDAVVGRIHPGAIIVLHEGHERNRVADMLDQILQKVRNDYEVTTVSDLLSGPNP
jgi:peptidoglycan/xylan/chitin deacetylase (PgdA/CDA1 family)